MLHRDWLISEIIDLIPGGFRLVAALGFVAPLAVALVGPLVGQTLDGIPRSTGLHAAVAGQSCLIITGGTYSASISAMHHLLLAPLSLSPVTISATGQAAALFGRSRMQCCLLFTELSWNV